jgi:hypothetical protein
MLRGVEGSSFETAASGMVRHVGRLVRQLA